EKYACPVHGSGLEELSPRAFSFNSPYGACPSCAGLGTKMEVDIDLLVPDRTLSIEEGVIGQLWRLGHAYAIWYGRAIRRFCKYAGVSTDTPIEKLPKDIFRALLDGVTPKQARDWNVNWKGLAVSLTERFSATENENIKARIHELMSDLSCPECKGARLRPEVLAVRVGGKNIQEITGMTIAAAYDFISLLPLEGEKARIAEPVVKEVRERLGFLN